MVDIPKNIKELEKEAKNNPEIKGTLTRGTETRIITSKDIKIKTLIKKGEE